MEDFGALNMTRSNNMKIKLAVVLLLSIFISSIHGVAYGAEDRPIIPSKEEIQPILQAIWKEMTTALAKGDIEKALTYFADASKDRYRREFTNLESIKSILSVKEIKLYSVDERLANCGAIRIEAGGTYSYPVTFVRYEDGIWNILGF
ncbi:MAG: hypothetical protein HZA00_07385 [Nitrospinae bacterium]|nr:hypothetical protein [Nitrospinota bacterium]